MNLPAARHGQRFAPRALIVDPDPQTRELHAAILTRVVPDIDQAQDGREALAKAIAHPPSFVITETRLPFISGYTLCSLLRAEPLTSDAAIVIVTGADELADAGQARSSGADSVLTKPVPAERTSRGNRQRAESFIRLVRRAAGARCAVTLGARPAHPRARSPALRDDHAATARPVPALPNLRPSAAIRQEPHRRSERPSIGAVGLLRLPEPLRLI